MGTPPKVARISHCSVIVIVSNRCNFLYFYVFTLLRSVTVSGVGLINEVNRSWGWGEAVNSTWMGDRLRAGKPSWYIISHIIIIIIT